MVAGLPGAVEAQPMSDAKLIQAWQNVLDALNALSDAADKMSDLVPDAEPQPGTDGQGAPWVWEGVMVPPQQVLGTFPAGDYHFNVEVTPPKDLIGKKKDFRVLLFDSLGKGRGEDPEQQLHVECGAQETWLYLGGHPHLGGEGWPGLAHDSFGNRHPSSAEPLMTNGLKLSLEEFALVLGETVTHDRGRVTSPAGTKYKITMRKVG